MKVNSYTPENVAVNGSVSLDIATKTKVRSGSLIKRFRMLCILLLAIIGTAANSQAATYKYTMTSSATGVSTATPGTSALLYSFLLTNTGTGANYLESFTFTTTGNVTSSDISSYSIYLSNTASLTPAAVYFGSASFVLPGAGTATNTASLYGTNLITWAASTGAYYVLIVANFTSTATNGHSVTVGAQTANGTWYTTPTSTSSSCTAGSACTISNNCNTTYFAYTGLMSNYTVPVGCTSIVVTAAGAQGGGNNAYANSYTDGGGLGGLVTASVSVTSGATLDVFVGGAGKFTGAGTSVAPGGWNGGGSGGFNTANTLTGGGGGGASDVSTSATLNSSTILVCAGGGGGAGFYHANYNYERGGAGGANTAGGGYYNNAAVAALGATQTTGGSGGYAAGTANTGANCNTATSVGNGGGGGGYFGGSAGVNEGSPFGSGGGGGSSYITGTASATATNTQGVNPGNGYVYITPLTTVETVTPTSSTACSTAGVVIGLAASQAGVSYQLYLGATAVGSPVAGSSTGAAISFATIYTSGTYSVTGTPTCGGTAKAMYGTAVITINTPPTAVSPTVTSPVCVGNTITFTGGVTGVSSAAYTYAWTGPTGSVSTSLNPTLSPSTLVEAGSYTLTVTTASCSGSVFGSTSSLVVGELPTAITPTVTPNPVCAGVGFTLNGSSLTGSTGALSYSWSGPTTGITSSTSQVTTVPSASTGNAGSFTITVTAAGCSGSVYGNTNANPLVVGQLPTTLTATVSPNPVSPCTSFSLTGTTGGSASTTYLWTGPGGGDIINPTLLGSTTNVTSAGAADGGVYTLTATSSGCGSMSVYTSSLTVTSPPALTSLSTSTSICYNASIGQTANFSYSATAGGAYQYELSWATSGPSAVSSFTSIPAGNIPVTVPAGTAAGVYTGTLTVQNPGGCSSNYILTLTVSQLPATLTATVSPTTVCAGTTINLASTLSGGGGYNLLWTGGTSVINNSTTIAANITSTVLGDAGIYTLTATAPACGSAKVTGTTTSLTVNQLPTTITATVSPTPVCAGNTISLTSTVTGGGGYSLLWTGGTSTINNSTTTTANIPAAALTDATGYTLTAIATACSGSTAGNTSTLVVNKLPTAFTATVSPNPGCIGSAVSLTATSTGGSGATYLWTGLPGGTTVSSSTSITSAGIGSVGSADAGVYTVTASASGCSGTASALTSSLALYSNPTSVTATVSTVTACVGSNITLTSTSSGATGYMWYGPGGTSITFPTSASTGVAGVNAANAGVYTLTASNAGCSVNATTSALSVTSAPLPITGYSSVIVGGTTILADATAGGIWTSGSGSIATVTTGTVTGVSAGTAAISYTTGCGSASENVNVYTSCGTTSLYTGSSTIPASDGIYLESFVMTGACSTSINQTALACNLSGTDYSNYKTLTPVQLYPGTVYPATLKDGGTYIDYMTVWIDFNDDGTFSSAEQVWVNSSGTPGTMSASFIIPAIGTNGCSYGTHVMRVRSDDNGTMSTGCVTENGTYPYGNTDDFLVSIVPATPTLTSNSPVCTVGGTLTLSVSPSVTSGATYAFSGPGGYTANTTNVNTTTYSPVAGTYSVTLSVNGVNSCPTPGTTTVSTYSAPVAISGSSSVCQGSTTLLTDGTSGGTWASVNPTIASISTGGTVTGISSGSATFSYTNGCGTAPTAAMTVNSLPVIVGETSICTSATETLTATPTGGSWASSTPLIATVGASSGILSTFTTTGNSITTYTSLLGCVASNTVTVTSSGGPSPITGTFTVCPGTYTLTSTPSGGVWSSSNPSVASINPSTGVVTAIVTGTTTMDYTEGCGSSVQVFSVNPSSVFTTVTATEDNLASNPLSFTGGSAYSSYIYSVTAAYGGVTNTLTYGTDYNYSTSALTLVPNTSTIDNYLNQAGTYTVSVYSTGYCTAVFTQSVSAGAANQMYQATNPTGPTYDGYALAVQPKIGFADQYGNHTTSFTSGAPTVTAAAGASGWTIGGTTSVGAVSGFVTYTSLTALSSVLVNTATVTYTSTGGISPFTATPTFTITPGSFSVTPNPVTLPSVYAGTGLGTASSVTLSEIGILPGSTFTVTPSADFEVYNSATSSWVAYPSYFTASSTGSYQVAFNSPATAGVYSEAVTFSSANATTYSLTCTATAIAAYTVPFFEGFEGDAVHAMPADMQGTTYTATTYYEVDNGAMLTAGYIENGAENGSGMYIVEGPEETGGYTYNWLGTKGIQLTGGTQYTFQVYYQQDYDSYANYPTFPTDWLGVNAYFTTSSSVPSTSSSTPTGGTAITGATTGAVTDDAWHTLRGTFTPSSSGIYYIDVCAHANTESFWFAFDDFSVCQVPTVTVTPSANPVCNGSTLTASVTPSASFSNSSAYGYSWSGAGGVTGTTTSISTVPVNTLTVSSYPVYSVSITSDVANTCFVTATLNETVTPTPSASFSYAGSPYCSSGSTASVTLGTGASAGTFSYSGTGTLSISPTTGAVNLASSTAGAYTVTNSVGASGGCSATSASSIITINQYYTTGFNYAGSPYCTTSGAATPTFTGGGVASAFTATPTGLSLGSTTGNITLASSAAGTYTVTNQSVVSGCATSSSTATVTVNGAVNVTTEPGNASVITGGTATYTVIATGTGLTYQWWEDIGGGSMSPITTAAGPYASGETYSGYNTSNLLSVANTNTGMNGYNYFCVVSGAAPCGTYTTTPEALLNVGANSFTLQPTSESDCPGALTTATLTAGTYTPPTNIYWLEKTPGGSFTLITGTTTPGGVSCSGAGTGVGDGALTLSLSGLTTTDNGFEYECEIDGGVYSSAATITVNTPVSVTTPPSPLSMCTSGTGTFSVVVAGTSPTYVWNVSTDGGSTWNPVSGSVYTGTATATLTITSPTSAMSSYQYECVIGGASPCSGTTSAPATLTVTSPAVITSSPSSISPCTTGVGIFTVAATGATSYHWWVNTSGIWSSLSDGGVYSGSGTATLTITNPPTSMNGYLYECVIGSTSPCGTVTSGAATLNVSSSPLTVSINTPSPLCIGGTTTLSAVATCSPATITNTVVAINFSSGFTGQIPSSSVWTAASGSTNTSTATLCVWTEKASSATTYPGNTGSGTGDYFEYINPGPNYAITQAAYIAGVTDRTLTSPVFSLAGTGVTDAVVNFGQFYYNNTGDTKAAVEITTNGGTTWTTVTDYHSGGSVGNATSFAASSVDLAAYCGNSSVQIRFHYITNGSSSTLVSFWWAVDNVVITTIQTPIYSYAWSGPATIGSPTAANTTVTPPGSGASVYGLTVGASDMTGCTATTSYTVTPSAQPALAYTVSTGTICEGSAASLTVTPTPGAGTLSYAWRGPGIATVASSTVAPTSFTPTVTGSPNVYTITATYSGSGCQVASVTPSINVQGALTVTPSNNGPICVGGSVNLASAVSGGSGTYTYSWLGDAGSGVTSPVTTASLVATPTTSSAHVYTLSVTSTGSTGSCASAVVTTTVTTNTLPAAPVSSAIPSSLCVGSTTVLTAGAISGGGGSLIGYIWNGSDGSYASVTTATVSFTPTVTTTYSLTVSESDGCTGTAVSTVTVSANPQPVITLTATPTAICVNGTTSISSTLTGGLGPHTYAWSGPGIATTTGSVAAPSSFTPSVSAAPGVYTVTVSYSDMGCTPAVNTVSVTVNGNLTVTPTNSGPICTGGTANLNAVVSGGGGSGSYTYLWSGASGDAGSGTIASASSATATATPSTTGAHTYFLTVNTTGGCASAIGTTIVSANALPVASISSASPNVLCVGTSTITPGYSGGVGTVSDYVWTSSDGSLSTTTSSYVAAVPTATTTYSVTVNTSGSGCTGIAAAVTTVTVNPQPSATVTPSMLNLCVGSVESLTSSVTGGAGTPTYTWSGPGITGTTATGATATYSLVPSASSGSYSLAVSYPVITGCTTAAATTASVNITPAPTVTSLTPSYVSLCSGASLTLTASETGGSGSPTYTWEGPGLSTTTSSSSPLVFTPTVAVATSAAYSVTVGFSGSGCATSPVFTSTTVAVNLQPTVSVSASPLLLCAGGNLTLTTASGGGAGTPVYTWSGPGITTVTGSSSGVSMYIPTTSVGAYTVSVSYSGYGCNVVAGTSSVVTVNDQPVVAISASIPGIICTGLSEDLSATITDGGVGTATYTWSGPGISGSAGPYTSSTYTVTPASGATAGVYSVVVTYSVSTGCTTATNATALVTPTGQQWTGSASTAWSNSSNWACGSVPTATENVTIPPTTNAPTLDVTGYTNNLTINSTAVLTLGTGNQLNVAGNIVNNATVNGSGVIYLNGTSPQVLSGNGTVSNLTLANSSGATINASTDTVGITGTLLLNSGTLTTGGSQGTLMLVSNSSGSASIGQITGGAITGNVVVQQYMPGGRRAYRFVAHPFSSFIALSQIQQYIDITGVGGATNGFTTTTSEAPSAFWYNTSIGNSSLGTDPGWTAFTSTSATLSANQFNQYEGIRLFFRGAKGEGLTGASYTVDPVTYRMIGTVNTGTQSITMVKGTGANEDYNLIGNPYPSPVDVGTAIHNAGALVTGGYFYVWDPYISTSGQFVTRSIATPYNMGANESFEVRTAANGNVLTFTESNKVSADSAILMRTASADNLDLNIYDNTYHLWDMLIFKFDDAATDNEDARYDGAKPPSPASLNFYSWSADNVKLAADVRPFTSGKVIPLGITSSYAQEFIMKADNVSLQANEQLYLHDKYLQTYTQLQQGTEYKFSITKDPASQGDKRFELSLNPSVAAQSNDLDVQMVPNPASSDVTISYTAKAKSQTTVRVMNAEGITVLTQDLGIQQAGSVQIALDKLASGVYLVEFTSGTDKVVHRLVKE